MVIKPTARQNPFSRKRECQNGAFYFSRARFYVFFIIFYVTDFFFLCLRLNPQRPYSFSKTTKRRPFLFANPSFAYFYHEQNSKLLSKRVLKSLQLRRSLFGKNPRRKFKRMVNKRIILCQLILRNQFPLFSMN